MRLVVFLPLKSPVALMPKNQHNQEIFMFDEKNFTQERYQRDFLQKEAFIKANFAKFNIANFTSFASDYKNYRHRAEFRIWHSNEDIFHLMFDASATDNKPKHIRIDTFAPASKIINQTMAAIIPELKHNQLLRNKLFQIEYLSSLTNEILVVLIYHKKLDETWLEEAKILAEKLKINLVGRSRKQKLVVNKDFIIEKMQVDSRQISLKQIENSFTQPNGKIAQDMLNWLYSQTQKLKSKLANTDLLELYSGNSFFSLALSPNFSKILNVEVAKTSTYAANYNILANNCANIKAINAKSEDIAYLLSASQVIQNSTTGAVADEKQEPLSANLVLEKSKKRLALELEKNQVKLNDYSFSSILVDPPRKGLDELTLKEAQKFTYIFYISCNIETLMENLQELTKTHKITDVAFFDQFPYTNHSEVGLVLTIRD